MYQKSIQSVNSFKSYRANKLKSTDRQSYRHTDPFERIVRFLSKVIVYTDRQTDTIPKTIFSHLTQEVIKRGDLMKNGGVKFCINLIPSLMRMQ